MITCPDFESQLDANPTDWTLRLVYSDWLEEHGDIEFAKAQRWMAKHKKSFLVDIGKGEFQCGICGRKKTNNYDPIFCGCWLNNSGGNSWFIYAIEDGQLIQIWRVSSDYWEPPIPLDYWRYSIETVGSKLKYQTDCALYRAVFYRGDGNVGFYQI